MSLAGLQEIVCCMGDAVAGNPFQYVVEKALAHHALEDWRCLTFRVASASLPDAVRGAKAMGFRGIFPAGTFQSELVSLVETLSPAATKSQRVDFVTRTDQGLAGDCLLGRCALACIGDAASLVGKKAVVLGSGAMARIMAVALADAKVDQIQLVARHPGRGQALTDFLNNDLNAKTQYDVWHNDFDLPSDADVIVNATSVGHGDAEARLPVQWSAVAKTAVVVDLTANPPQTRFIRDAAQHGCRTVDGLAIMLEHFAVMFQTWTSADPPREIMREALEEFFEV